MGLIRDPSSATFIHAHEGTISFLPLTFVDPVYLIAHKTLLDSAPLRMPTHPCCVMHSCCTMPEMCWLTLTSCYTNLIKNSTVGHDVALTLFSQITLLQMEHNFDIVSIKS